MSKYIINVKNILKIIILVFVIINCIKSCSKAADTTIQAEIREKLQVLCEKQAYGLDQYAYENINLSEFGGSNYFIIIGKGNNNNYNGQLSTNYRLYIGEKRNNNTITNQTNDRSNFLYNTWSGIWDIHQYNLNGSKINKGNLPLNNLVEPFYCYTTVQINTRVLTLGANQEYGGSYIFSAFEFEPYGEQVTYQDYVDKPYAIKYSYDWIDWKLGKVEDWAGFDNFTVDLSDENGIVGEFDYMKSGTYVPWGLYKNNDDEVYIEGRKLFYNKVYTLMFYCYSEVGLLEDSYGYNFLFLPTNATIENGTITNYGSGDFTVQDSTNLIIDNQVSKDDLTTIIGTAPSGDQPRYWSSWFPYRYSAIRR